jgi:hypothetical protein
MIFESGSVKFRWAFGFELPLEPWRLLHGGWAVLQGQVLAGRVVDLVAV